MSIADLELAVETAQRNTDVSRATWASFVSLVVSGHERLADGTLRGKKRLRAKRDLKFATDQAVAAEKDHRDAMAAELRLRRELDEARKNPWEPISTAPTSGYFLAVYDGNEFEQVRRDLDVPDEFRDRVGDQVGVPDFWMPLPAGLVRP